MASIPGNRRLYREIAEWLAAAIQRGHYAVGQRLPTERDLARDMGVSRASVREALIALEVAGYVEARGGSGVYVLPPRASAPTADRALCGEAALLEGRALLEGEAAARAAQLASEADLLEIQDAAARAGTFAADRTFHVRIAQASGDPALALVVRSLWDSGLGIVPDRRPLPDPELQARVAAEYSEVCAAIAERDSARAREAMRRHIFAESAEPQAAD